MRNMIKNLGVTTNGELCFMDTTGLGEYLYGLRKCQTKVSLERMAERVGCSKSYLWDVENNRSMPTLAMAVKIAKEYKTSLNQMGKHV